jgi:hypothetical protein
MTQSQREALLDLLHIAILSDSHVSLKEEQELAHAIEAIGWESSLPREIHLLNSIAERAAAFASSAEQEEALAILQSLLASDASGVEESAFLAQVRGFFPEWFGREAEGLRPRSIPLASRWKDC